MTKIIDVLFKEWWKLWELRNGDRHGRDASTRATAENRQILSELIQFYENHKDTAPQRLQWLFDIPLMTRMQLQTAVIWQWLDTWKPIIEKSYTTALETG